MLVRSMLGKEEEAEKLHQEFEDFKNDFAQKQNEQEAPTVLIDVYKRQGF